MGQARDEIHWAAKVLMEAHPRCTAIPKAQRTDIEDHVASMGYTRLQRIVDLSAPANPNPEGE